MRALRISIVGAGIGGLAAAAVLRQKGMEVTVYEQTAAFARVGAGIQVSPNAMRVLRGLGLEQRIRDSAFQPGFWRNRDFDTGGMRFEFPLGAEAEARYGAPYLLMHRADLHAGLLSLLPPGIIRLGCYLMAVEEKVDGVVLRFADGSEARADMVIGADGVHSPVREHLHGAKRPRFSGRVAYRTVFPAALLGNIQVDDNTKWWGRDRHIVIYYVNSRRDELYFVTSVPEGDWTSESWSSVGNVKALRDAFAEFHPDVRHVLAFCPKVHKWAIVQRDPLPFWSSRRIVLRGDSCHPMTPYMAQGAAMAMEDAVVLGRCLDGADADALPERFRLYELTRKARTARVQIGSHENRFMSGRTNPDWVYAYDAWSVPLGAVPEVASA
jgi:6-hydroxynicotinate 3-monooxygenase